MLRGGFLKPAPRPLKRLAMLKIAVVDDDAVFLNDLIEKIESYPNRGSNKLLTVPFSSAEDLLVALHTDFFDLVILDVVMPGRSGLEAARDIFNDESGTFLAFVSSSPEHAHGGYGVNALAYLLKPVEEAAVHRLLDDALARRVRRKGGGFVLKTGRSVVKIDLSQVVYLESDNKRVHFHGQDGSGTYVGKLADFLSQLPVNFIQVHKSYAVNLDHMRALRPGEMIAADGRLIPISRRYRPTAEALYLAHVAAEV